MAMTDVSEISLQLSNGLVSFTVIITRTEHIMIVYVDIIQANHASAA